MSEHNQKNSLALLYGGDIHETDEAKAARLEIADAQLAAGEAAWDRYVESTRDKHDGFVPMLKEQDNKEAMRKLAIDLELAMCSDPEYARLAGVATMQAAGAEKEQTS